MSVVKNPDFEPFFNGLRILRGPQKKERKDDNNSIIWGAKNKAKSDFLREKLMEV